MSLAPFTTPRAVIYPCGRGMTQEHASSRQNEPTEKANDVVVDVCTSMNSTKVRFLAASLLSVAPALAKECRV